ncbi:MAG: isoprenyl transferase [Gammaproteobacteria bacterium]|nr:isoprenyl transferase [Gammaproteobacteria bacterium]
MSEQDEKQDLQRFSTLPRHVAIIMDGNGRWAEKRFMGRIAGHKAGVEAVRSVVRACSVRGIEALTLFAFSTENWKRPKDEVSWLMDMFLTALSKEVKKLHENNIRLRVIGDTSAFSDKLQQAINKAESLTQDNQGLNLNIAVNYGGRLDIAMAMQKIGRRIEAGELRADEVTPELIQQHVFLGDLPEPDLFIRTGGEERISNFLLWQLAYSELYFTDVLWPDFDNKAFDDALASFASRQRRFGRTGAQVEEIKQCLDNA